MPVFVSQGFLRLMPFLNPLSADSLRSVCIPFPLNSSTLEPPLDPATRNPQLATALARLGNFGALPPQTGVLFAVDTVSKKGYNV